MPTVNPRRADRRARARLSNLDLFKQKLHLLLACFFLEVGLSSETYFFMLSTRMPTRGCNRASSVSYIWGGGKWFKAAIFFCTKYQLQITTIVSVNQTDSFYIVLAFCYIMKYFATSPSCCTMCGCCSDLTTFQKIGILASIGICLEGQICTLDVC